MSTQVENYHSNPNQGDFSEPLLPRQRTAENLRKLLRPAPLKTEGELAIAQAAIATQVKESYQQLIGVGDRNQIEYLEDKLRFEGVKAVFQGLDMLPEDDQMTDEQAADFVAAYRQALDHRPGTDELGNLFDKYGESPAAKCIEVISRSGVNRTQTAPMLRTVLMMMDRDGLAVS